MQSLCLPADHRSFTRFRTFVLAFLEQQNISAALAAKIDLILEELLTNIINYAYPDERGDIEITCSVEPNRAIRLTIQDWGTAFNPLTREAPDLSSDIDNRAVGGLGVFLVGRLADDLSYRRENNMNILTVRVNETPKENSL